MHRLDAALLADVDLLCLDAGNTVVFLDHARIAALCARVGFATDGGAVEQAEGRAKRRLEEGTALHAAWNDGGVQGARSWAGYIGTLLEESGLPRAEVGHALDVLWPEHRALNLWSRVPDGLVPALARARAGGLKVAMVSNSEGMLEELLHGLGVMPGIDFVVDSGRVGVEKPDPEVFRIALRAAGVAASYALHLGDIPATDVVGARAAGLRVALVDPFGHLEGRHAEVPRVPGAREVAEALAARRGV